MIGADLFKTGVTPSAPVIYPYTIAHSLRCPSEDTLRAYAPDVTADSRRVQTFIFQGVKRCKMTRGELLSIWSSTSFRFVIGFNGDNKLEVYSYSAGYQLRLISNAVFRDPTQHYAFTIQIDTTQPVAADRCKVFLYDEQITDWDTATYPSQNTELSWGTTGYWVDIARRRDGYFWFDGYLSGVYRFDNAIVAPPFTRQNNVAVPTAVTGTYGAAGFRFLFDNAANLLEDTSGNGNHLDTVYEYTAANQSTDTPTNNHCTLSSINAQGVGNGIHDAGLRPTAIGAAWYLHWATHPLPETGKWAWRVTSLNSRFNTTSSAIYRAAGVVAEGVNPPNFLSTPLYGWVDTGWWCAGDGSVRTQEVGSDWGNGDTFDFLADMDARTLTVEKNGTPLAKVIDLPTTGVLYPVLHRFGDVTYGNFRVDFGQDGYTPPAGFQALNAANILATSPLSALALDPTQGFDVVSRAGTGASTSPTTSNKTDLVWIKNRSQADSHHLFDAVRGATEALFSNATTAETTDADGLTAFGDSNGYTLGAGVNGVNDNAENFVDWVWTEGATYGFDIVAYTGNGANRTISHGLGAAPEMILIKNRDQADAWAVYHAGVASDPETDYLVLNTTAARVDDATFWQDTAPTGSVFSLGTNVAVNTSTEDYIAYLWRSVPGFSRFGHYIGNGNADGPFVWCGFRPRFVMFKRVDSTGDWEVIDAERSPFNFADENLSPNSTSTEGSGNGLDLTAAGFKVRTGNSGWNANSGRYIFAAFAEQPFPIANAR